MTEGQHHQGRGRVVMLVDNGVHGDSRVQKAARSAAERGWDVVLLGKSPDTKVHRWKIGDARVRLVPVTLPRRRHESRRGWLRSPFAYPAGPVVAQREHAAAALQASVREARLRHAERYVDRPALLALPGLTWLLARRLRARATVGWVGFRARRTRALLAARKRMDGPLDRATTAFWKRTMGNRSWRRLDPSLWAWELALGPVIDGLRPDLIHANDFRVLGVGARAKLRAREAGRDTKLVWDAHEFLPALNPWDDHPRWLPAQVAHEAEFARDADAVVTVSDQVAELLVEQHGLAELPAVVRNTPTVGIRADRTEPGVRELCGLAADVPLLLYVGVMNPVRGVDLLVEALAQLDGVHVAFVARQSKNTERVLARAHELAVADRVHVVPYVPVDDICSYIASADVGVVAAQHQPNNEISLPTKFYEYALARLPMVVSDVRTVAETTTALGQGEVFRAGDVDDFVRAARTVLSDRERYRAAYDAAEPWQDWIWDRQADVLDAVYSRLRGESSSSRS